MLIDSIDLILGDEWAEDTGNFNSFEIWLDWRPVSIFGTAQPASVLSQILNILISRAGWDISDHRCRISHVKGDNRDRGHAHLFRINFPLAQWLAASDPTK